MHQPPNFAGETDSHARSGLGRVIFGVAVFLSIAAITAAIVIPSLVYVAYLSRIEATRQHPTSQNLSWQPVINLTQDFLAENEQHRLSTSGYLVPHQYATVAIVEYHHNPPLNPFTVWSAATVETKPVRVYRLYESPSRQGEFITIIIENDDGLMFEDWMMASELGSRQYVEISGRIVKDQLSQAWMILATDINLDI